MKCVEHNKKPRFCRSALGGKKKTVIPVLPDKVKETNIKGLFFVKARLRCQCQSRDIFA